MRTVQQEIGGVDPEIRRILEWAGSTAPGARRMIPEAADVRPDSEGTLAGAILGSLLSAALFSGLSQLVVRVSF